MRAWRRPTATAATGMMLVLVAGACGVQSERRPQRISASDIPYGLLEAAPSTTTSTTSPEVPKVGLSIFLVQDDQLQAVARQVTEPLTVAKVLSTLLSGPTDEEAAAGLRSAINPAASLVPSRPDPATVLVDLSPEFAHGTTAEQVLGLAQIVFSVTEVPGVTGVRFSLAGAPIEVPTATGTTSSPLGRDAFTNLVPAPPGPAAAS